MPTREFLAELKAAGFDGMESRARDASEKEAAEARKLAESMGM